MKNILVIGAGGVGGVTVNKCLSLNTNNTIKVFLASRSIKKCQKIADSQKTPIDIFTLDANNPTEIITLIQQLNIDIVINCALPLQNIPIMKACIQTKTHYIDTSDPEVDASKFELVGSYRWQWEFDKAFKDNNITAILSCGFDPGIVNAYCKYAEDDLFDEIETIDIVDCNGGNHGYPFATNFNPIVNLQEVTQNGIYYKNNQWIETRPLELKHQFDFPEIGQKDMYLMYHPELETLAKHLKPVAHIRFWMTFSDQYLKHLDVLQNINLINTTPIDVNGTNVVPLEMLQTLLPDPASLGKKYTGKTCIGCIITGKKDGQTQTLFIYNNCDHKTAFKETGFQAVPYTTGVPAATAAECIIEGIWNEPGVWSVEQLKIKPFLKKLNQYGLPHHIIKISNPF